MAENTTKKPQIAILDDYYNRAPHYADWQSCDIADFVFFDKFMSSEQELVENLSDFDAIGIMRERTPFPASLINQLPKLKLLITSGKKNASIDVKAANAAGVTVCGTESPGHATAELALLLVMSLSRKLIPLVNELKNHGAWQPEMGRDLRGRNLGILGLGRLGSQLAGFAQALGMNVLAWSENLQETQCAEKDVAYVSREELFKQSDFVSIHLRHSDRSHHMVNLDDLKQLGPDSYIINTSRAEIIDPIALKTVLDEELIAGAATDVYEVEPADNNSWMVNHSRILATPHIGYCTAETFEVFYQQMLEGFIAYYGGNPIRVIG